MLQAAGQADAAGGYKVGVQIIKTATPEYEQFNRYFNEQVYS